MKNVQLILKYTCMNAESKNYINKTNMVSLREFYQHNKFIIKLLRNWVGVEKWTGD